MHGLVSAVLVCLLAALSLRPQPLTLSISDLHEYLIGPTHAPSTPHPLTGEVRPTVVGHEFSGTIVECGEGVTDLKAGQKVAVFPVLTDMTCHWCDREAYGLCAKWGFLGYSGYGGGMAEYVCVEQRAIHKLPDDMPLEIGALVEPLAVGWHAVKLAPLKSTDTALVLGAGPIGIAVILCLRAFGVQNIVVSELSAVRGEHARDAGASHVLDPRKDDVVAKCNEVAGQNKGAHAVFECAGVQASFQAALEAVGGLGTIVTVAIWEDAVKFQPNMLNRKQARIFPSNIYTRGEFQEVIDAIAEGTIHPVILDAFGLLMTNEIQAA